MKLVFFIAVGILCMFVIAIALILISEKQDGFKAFTTVKLSGQILSLDLDKNHNVLVGSRNGNHNGTIYYLDTNGKIILQKTIPRIIGFVDVSDNGRYIVTKGYELTDGRGQAYYNNLIELFDNNMTKMWDFPKRELSLIPDDVDYASYAVATDSTGILIAHEDELRRFDYSGNSLWNETIAGKSGSISISENAKIMAVGTYDVLDDVDYDWGLNVFAGDGHKLWDKSGINYHVISDNAVAVSRSGNYIALGLAASGDEGTIQFFDKFGSLMWTDITDSVVLGVYFSPNEKNLIASTNNGLRFYDMHGNLLWTKHETFYPRFSTDYIIGTSPVEYHYVLKIMDYSGKIISEFKIDTAVRDVVITDDSSVIVVGTKGTSDIGLGTLYYFKQ